MPDESLYFPEYRRPDEIIWRRLRGAGTMTTYLEFVGRKAPDYIYLGYAFRAVPADNGVDAPPRASNFDDLTQQFICEFFEAASLWDVLQLWHITHVTAWIKRCKRWLDNFSNPKGNPNHD
jgi:hypothetical protein